MVNKARREIAADWWIHSFKYPVFDNGDSSPLIMALPYMLAKDALVDIDPNAFVEFKRLFVESDSMQFYCDYKPEAALYDLMHSANVPMELASWKTDMQLYPDGRISVKAGYGKPYKFLGDSDED